MRHYFKNEEKGVLINMKPATNQVVNLPNNEVMTYYFKGQIPASLVLSKNARYPHFSDISTVHLSSIYTNYMMMNLLLF